MYFVFCDKALSYALKPGSAIPENQLDENILSDVLRHLCLGPYFPEPHVLENIRHILGCLEECEYVESERGIYKLTDLGQAMVTQAHIGQRLRKVGTVRPGLEVSEMSRHELSA